MSKLALRTAFAAVAGILIAIGGCAENPASISAPTDSYQIISVSGLARGELTSAVIGPEGGTLQIGIAKVYFPAGAVAQPTRISMQADLTSLGVIMQPHGIVFPENAQPVLTLDVSSVVLSAFRNTAIAYIDENGQISEILPTELLGSSGKARTTLPHFSKFSYVGS